MLQTMNFKADNMAFSSTEMSLTYRNTQRPEERTAITASSDAYFFLKPYYGMDIELKEKSFAVYVNQSNQVIGVYKISEGGLCSTVIDIRLVLSIGLQTLATGIIIAHNHPSGHLRPSSADREITKKIKQAASLVDIRLLDHIIMSDYSYYSFADEGTL